MPQVPPRALIGIASLSIGIASLFIGIASLFIGIASLSPSRNPRQNWIFWPRNALYLLFTLLLPARARNRGAYAALLGSQTRPKPPPPTLKMKEGGRSPLAPLGLIGRDTEWPATPR